MKLSTLRPIVQSKDLFFPFGGNVFNSLFSDLPEAADENVLAFKPGANILETDKAYEIQLALPVLKKEEVKIDLRENNLTISGERNTKSEETKGTWHYSEIRQGKFSRTFMIPENIVQENIEANFADGMLDIVLPKAEPKQAKAISIK
jgi:HSP20 family protein